MNLIFDRWMWVRLRDGRSELVAPTQLGRSDILGFDAVRPDFNGAWAQFAIGLLQTGTPVNNAVEWRRRWGQPPDEAELAAWFAPFKAAFECEGDGPRFMQDLELAMNADELLGVGSLLIEGPSANALDSNTDHFVKRGGITQLCSQCAVTALFTLQINAPSGGVGYRTSVRGGGPLTTVLTSSSTRAGEDSLWHSLWLNVMDQPSFENGGGSPERTEPWARFPWMTLQSRLQPKGASLAPSQVHPAHVFWAMPRRIRFAPPAHDAGECDLCGRTAEQLIRHYATQNYGLDYKGPWRHPLSPYYASREGLLPMHPQPGGFGYRHWAEWAVGLQGPRRQVEAARTVSHFLASGMERRRGLRLQLWAFGFDMDNAKARCWYESTVPLYELAACEPEVHTELSQELANWVSAAELAVGELRNAVKKCRFAKEVRGDFSFVDASFWSATEAEFYRLLQTRIHAAQAGQVFDRVQAAQRWLEHLLSQALNLFDKQFAGSGLIERENPRRIAAARQKLWAMGDALRVALNLPIESGTTGKSFSKKRTANETPTSPKDPPT
jgi:CRISPR system Cascade subunit CasA